MFNDFGTWISFKALNDRYPNRRDVSELDTNARNANAWKTNAHVTKTKARCIANVPLKKLTLIACTQEVAQIQKDIVRLGAKNGDGKFVVKYGILFDDEIGQQYYETLMGTLKAAKKRGLIDFKGQMLLKGVNDSVEITLIADPQ